MSLNATSLSDGEVSFGKTTHNQPVIKFFDPAFTRAEAILFEASTGDIHAVLHENLHFLGRVPRELGASFQKGGAVLLLGASGQVRPMNAPLSLVKN
jgi:hypothetical protein